MAVHAGGRPKGAERRKERRRMGGLLAWHGVRPTSPHLIHLSGIEGGRRGRPARQTQPLDHPSSSHRASDGRTNEVREGGWVLFHEKQQEENTVGEGMKYI